MATAASMLMVATKPSHASTLAPSAAATSQGE
jgi:hypothetical protein